MVDGDGASIQPQWIPLYFLLVRYLLMRMFRMLSSRTSALTSSTQSTTANDTYLGFAYR